MIIDSSALLAILFDESDARRHASAVMAAESCRMSVASVLEASIFVECRGGGAAAHELDVLLERAEVELVAVTAKHLNAASVATFWEELPPNWAELWRLLRLRACRGDRRAAAFQG